MQRSDSIVYIGEQIRILRKRKKLTLLTLATTCEISEKHLGQIERGKSNATIDLVEKIARALDVDMHRLLGPSDDSLISHENLGTKEITTELKQIIENVDAKTLQLIYRVVKACQG